MIKHIRYKIAAVALFMGVHLVPTHAVRATELGANKFDLLMQYTGRASGGDGSVAYRRVTTAMAKKAILDGKDAGFTFFRVGVTGYAPSRPGTSSSSNDLGLWQADPHAYWLLVDSMFDDLDRANMQLVPTFVWNFAQFPALAGEPGSQLVRDERSRGRLLLNEYIQQFITRYKGRKTILFYELSNELNLLVDLDLGRRCMTSKPASAPADWCDKTDHFDTADMISFSSQMVPFIKRLDPTRDVTSGYGLPTMNAYHLEKQPEFSQKGADWTADTIAQFRDNLSRTQAAFDIISIHVYPSSNKPRYGRPPGYATISDVAAVARAGHKRLFLGEFGDTGDTAFMTDIMDAAVRDGFDYASVWVWEFYQSFMNQAAHAGAPNYSLEPGFTDDKIRRLRATKPPVTPTGSLTTSPRVVLTWPIPCRRVDQSIELSAVASAGGPDALDHVDFLVNHTLIASTKSPPFHTQFSPSAMGDQKAVISARAVTRDGKSDTFDSVVLLNRDREDCVVSGSQTTQP